MDCYPIFKIMRLCILLFFQFPVAAWTTKASLALVETMISNKEEYLKPIRRPKFWTEIMNLMVQQKFFYTDKQCETRMADLKCMYKNDVEDGEKTGAPGPMLRVPDQRMRELLAKVGELLEGCVSVRPKITFAAGFHTQDTHCEKVSKYLCKHFQVF